MNQQATIDTIIELVRDAMAGKLEGVTNSDVQAIVEAIFE